MMSDAYPLPESSLSSLSICLCISLQLFSTPHNVGYNGGAGCPGRLSPYQGGHPGAPPGAAGGCLRHGLCLHPPSNEHCGVLHLPPLHAQAVM